MIDAGDTGSIHYDAQKVLACQIAKKEGATRLGTSERFEARIQQQGAQLKSLREMGSGAEYIWPGGEQRWSGLAPVLLPIVGGLAVQYDVKNTRPDPLYFSIGSHPALRVPFAGGYLDNYYLRLGLFDQGVLIFKNLRSRVVSIRNSRNARAVSISTGGVPFMDVWAKPGRCPFLCLEPWSGLLDSPSATGELSQKEGILRLELGGEFTSTYRIEIA